MDLKILSKKLEEIVEGLENYRQKKKKKPLPDSITPLKRQIDNISDQLCRLRSDHEEEFNATKLSLTPLDHTINRFLPEIKRILEDYEGLKEQILSTWKQASDTLVNLKEQIDNKIDK